MQIPQNSEQVAQQEKKKNKSIENSINSSPLPELYWFPAVR